MSNVYVLQKKAFVENILSYITETDEILELKKNSPGFDAYNKCNLAIGIVGVLVWCAGVAFTIVMNRRQRIQKEQMKYIEDKFIEDNYGDKDVDEDHVDEEIERDEL